MVDVETLLICPYCGRKVEYGPIGLATLEEDLNMFGKHVVICRRGCGQAYLIRDEDETGPFISPTRKGNENESVEK